MNAQLKIFVLHASDMLTDYLPNGEGWIAYNYLKGLTERGHTVHVSVPRVEFQHPTPPRMHVHLIPKRSGTLGRIVYMRAVRHLLKRLRQSVQFDLVQQFTPVETGLSLSALGSGVPLVLGPYPSYWPLDAFKPNHRTSVASKLKRVIRDGFALLQQKLATALIVTCPAGIGRIISSNARRTRVHVVSPGVHVQTYSRRTAAPQKRSILFLANLEYRKGIFTLLEAFGRVAQAIPDCSLEIWGEGSQVDAVEKLILQSPFRDRIFIRGLAPREKVGEIMRSHSVYCLPSYGEPFGMTLLEAMASGLPIVTTNVGGPPYLVHDSGGRIIPPRDAVRLADALIEILSSAELQESMGAYNCKRVEQEFSWSKSIDRLESVYEWVLSSRVPAAVLNQSDSSRYQ